MKELFIQYALYNKWANDKIMDTVLQMSSEITDKPIESSFGSLRLTILHLWFTESLWWQRLHLTEKIVTPASDSNIPLEAVCDGLKKQSLQWYEWVVNAKDLYLNHVFAYRNSRGEEYKQPVFQMLLHLFNHQSYHRGQVIVMLRQSGVKKLPNTDFINWSRNRK